MPHLDDCKPNVFEVAYWKLMMIYVCACVLSYPCFWNQKYFILTETAYKYTQHFHFFYSKYRTWGIMSHIEFSVCLKRIVRNSPYLRNLSSSFVFLVLSIATIFLFLRLLLRWRISVEPVKNGLVDSDLQTVTCTWISL